MYDLQDLKLWNEKCIFKYVVNWRAADMDHDTYASTDAINIDLEVRSTLAYKFYLYEKQTV